MGGQLLVVMMPIDGECCKIAEDNYKKQMAFARKAAAAKNNDTLRYVIAEWHAEEGKAPDPEAVTDIDIMQFKDEDLPGLEKFAAGDPSRERYIEDVSTIVKSRIPFFDVLKGSLSIFTALWLFLGVGSAYRIAAGGSVLGGERETVRRQPRRRIDNPEKSPPGPESSGKKD